MNKIQDAIDHLEKTLRTYVSKETDSFTVFVNCEGREVTINERKPEQLKAEGISMRNLAGEFIK
tara:strand:- start:2852 stop:3043 length:192 start_codon:yes stop_codon:yes gene_type:complete